ncbi:hypothetical protein CVT24_009310 [Panaeolus cyanescens]|uniref:Hydrophobin n=1 Tax=Panaeolus cyanescens TaxID=181874 RepID=A0A409Y842_9AGAR|nr:hypothetical protein CVT24_009310 [Panaeolus cyanescens]
MLKFVTSLAVFAAVAAQALALRGSIPVGGVCATIAGPVSGACELGSTCCYVHTDLGLCASGNECPSAFIPEGELCSGIAGPLPLPCFPGTTCCNLGPDHSQCLTEWINVLEMRTALVINCTLAAGPCPTKFIPEGSKCDAINPGTVSGLFNLCT